MPAILYILVVDDRPDSILFLTEFLLSRGHRVETCCNGAEARDAVLKREVTQDPYDLVISDVAMPGMDGLTMLQELRRQKLDVPLALYTGYATINPELTVKANALGCLAVMDKPLELRRIERLTEEVAARKVEGLRQARTGTTRHAGGTGALERKRSTQPATAPFLASQRAAGSSRIAGIATPPNPGTGVQTSSFAMPARSAESPPPPGGSLPTPESPPPPTTSPVTSTSIRRSSEPRDKTSGIRRPSGLFLHNTSSISKRNSTTARIRRTISGSHLPATPPPENPPPVSPPTGRHQHGDASRAVSCAHCAKIFLVLVKPIVYNSVCVHCGGLNRIDPF